MVVELAPEIEHIIQFTANMLKGAERRCFMAEVAEQLCCGSPRLAETEFGCGRAAVTLDINEKRTGLICYGNYAPCGKQKPELSNPKLEADIRSLVDPEGQADPRLRNAFVYTRITAKSVRQKRIDEKKWEDNKHSKYNPIERPWSSLEKHWNGALLNTVQSVLEWTKTMTWKCINPVVHFPDKIYSKGVRPDKSELAGITPHVIRHSELPKWDITIVPEPVNS